MKGNSKIKKIEEALERKNKELLSSVKKELSRKYSESVKETSKAISKERHDLKRKTNKIMDLFEKKIQVFEKVVLSIKKRIKALNDKYEKCNLENFLEEGNKLKNELIIISEKKSDDLIAIKNEQEKIYKREFNNIQKSAEREAEKCSKRMNSNL